MSKPRQLDSQNTPLSVDDLVSFMDKDNSIVMGDITEIFGNGGLRINVITTGKECEMIKGAYQVTKSP